MSLFYSHLGKLVITRKTDRHDITDILLKVALSTINQPNQPTNQPTTYVINFWNVKEKMQDRTHLQLYITI